MASFVTVNFDFVPDVFHNSGIFKSRNKMINKDQIVLLKNVCNFDFNMSNYTELCSALETLRYWRFDKTPISFYNNVLARRSAIRKILLENDNDLLLRFHHFKPFAETCVLAISNTAESYELAQQLGLSSLMNFLE